VVAVTVIVVTVTVTVVLEVEVEVEVIDVIDVVTDVVTFAVACVSLVEFCATAMKASDARIASPLGECILTFT
jgi:hypothetical protein